MSNRLSELQRQRALVQEQLAWLEREIARESGSASAPLPATPVTLPIPVSATAEADTDRQAEKILAQYRHLAHPVRNEVRRGCFLYFFAAFAALGMLIATLYFVRKQRAMEEQYAEPTIQPSR